MESGKFGLATTLGLALAALGLIAPIAWDRYKSKTDLQLQHLGTTTLLEADRSLEKVVVTYDGRAITSLAKVDVALVNTGRTAIREADLIAPPTIRFRPPVRVLEVRRESVTPENLESREAVVGSNVALTFPLLNPGDYIKLGIIDTGAPVSFSADARVVGLAALRTVEKEQRVAERRPRPWLLIVVAFFTLVAVIATLGLFAEVRRDSKLRRRLKTERLLPVETADKSEYVLFVDDQLGYRVRAERRPFYTLFANLPDGPLSPQARTSFENLLNHVLTRNSARRAVWVAFVISGVGIYYLGANAF